MESLANSLGVSREVALAVVLLAVLQIITQIYALLDLVRRDAVTGEKKWVWALVIVLGNLLGAILYLAAGRQVTAIRDAATTPDTGARGRAASTADLLYGTRDADPSGDRRCAHSPSRSID